MNIKMDDLYHEWLEARSDKELDTLMWDIYKIQRRRKDNRGFNELVELIKKRNEK